MNKKHLVVITDFFKKSLDDPVYREVMDILKNDFNISDAKDVIFVENECGHTYVYERGIPVSLLKRAIKFYEQSPDGQYDLTVVVPILESELKRRLEVK